MKPLLLLVDLQRDFLSASALAPTAGVVIDGASSLLSQCRARGLPVVHVWTTVSRQPDNRMLHWKDSGRWRCVEGTPGHAPPPELLPRDGEPIIHKQGFAAFAGGRLLEILRDGAVDTLLVTGVHLHACVRQAVLDAHQEGLRVWVAEDAVASDDPIHAAITRRYLEERSVRFLPVADLAGCLSDSRCDVSGVCDAPTEVAKAVGRAAAFLPVWRGGADRARYERIEALASRLAGDERQLARLMAGEIGKPIRHGGAEVRRTVEMLHDILHRWQSSRTGEGIQGVDVRRRPHGVVAVITPWNNPIYITIGKILPAVLYGNTVVWKPAPEARDASRRLASILHAAGWPEGLVVPVEGGRHDAMALMSDRRVAAVSLTGSSAAGFSAQEICARRRIPLQAELGGNNAAIVWSDTDLAEAARSVAAGAFEMGGQRCTANRRVIVHKGCREQFIQLLMASAAELNWGDPLNEATDIGPLVNEEHRERVARCVERAEAVLGPALRPLGAEPPQGGGCWYPPTVICCDDPDLEIVQEETFGPVLVVQTARDWDQAITLCNGVRQGLAATIFTSSPEMTRRFFDAADAGILKVNVSTADAAVGVPFGGWKASGLGPPEHGEYDRDFFTRPQTVYGHPAPLPPQTPAHPAHCKD